MKLLQQMDQRRRAGDYLHALQLITGPEGNKEDAFRAHFLGKGSDGGDQTCLLLEAASQGHAAAILEELANDSIAHNVFPSEYAYFMFQARMKLIESVQLHDDSSQSVIQLISVAVDLYRRAYQFEKGTLPPTEAGGTPDFVRKLQGRWKTALLEVEKQKRFQASHVADWDDPVLLMVAESLYYLLNDGTLSMEGIPVESSVLLAMATEKTVVDLARVQKSVKIPEGFLAQLVIEKVQGGTGLLYPDCRYCGYLPLAPDFRQGLRNVMTVLKRREEWSDPQAFLFNYRWRLIPLSPKSGFKLPQAVGAIDGRSAEAAFASAILASARNERIDQQTVISACFDEPETNDRLHQVASVSEKLLAFRDEQLDDHPEDLHFVGMKTHLLHKFVLYEKEENQQALPHEAKVYDWTVRFSYVETFDQAYRLLTGYCRNTDLVKNQLLARAIRLLEGTCNPYVFSKLSVLQKEKTERMGPELENKKILTREETESLLLGNFETNGLRKRILAESGLGKSTLLIKAEEMIASSVGDRIPLRIGAGPMSLSTDDSGDLLRLPALSDFKWDIRPSELDDFLSLLAQRVFSEFIPDKAERDQWICEAVQRGNVVFLLDALDQTSEAPRFQNFLTCDGVNRCPVIITGRPETRQLKRMSYDQQYDWEQNTFFAEPFDKEQVVEFWGDMPLPIELFDRYERVKLNVSEERLEELRERSGLWTPLLTEWGSLLKVPILLSKIKELAEYKRIINLKNREAVYYETLGMIVDHGHKSSRQIVGPESEFKGLDSIESLLGEIAWEMISQEVNQSDKLKEMASNNFTGELTGRAYTAFYNNHKSLFAQLDGLNLTTRQTFFDQNHREQTLFAWRHFSFCEWFAGLHLSTMKSEQQERWIELNTFDPRWRWVFRFSLSAADRDNQLDEKVVNHLATCLLKYGGAFLLWEIIKQDKVQIHPELELLCRWLVHRDIYGRGAWEGSPDKSVEKIQLNEKLVAILQTMFSCEEPYLYFVPKYRDSRWLHPAWELIETNLPGSASSASEKVKLCCRKIYDEFLSEFEDRVLLAAERNRGKGPKDWDRTDRGILQLVPDDCFLESPLDQFKILTQDELDSFRTWPASMNNNDYARRRDQFNQHLSANKVNYCLCPPYNWERCDGLDPREFIVGGFWRRKFRCRIPLHYMLQRTPMTNLQFEVFDPHHQQFRQWQWRSSNETDENQLDDHPVVEVSRYMSEMMTIWMTGQGTFGTFRLPGEWEWEACSRAGGRFAVPSFEDISDGRSLKRRRKEEGRKKRVRPISWGLFGRTATDPVNYNKDHTGNNFGLIEMGYQVREWCEILGTGKSNNHSHRMGALRGRVWNKIDLMRISNVVNDAEKSTASHRDKTIGMRIHRTK